MYVEKIFSDYNDEERLYSVIMTEDEYALFSNAQEEEKKKAKKIKNIGKYLALGSAGVALAGGLAQHKIMGKAASKAAKEVGGIKLGRGGRSNIMTFGPNALERLGKAQNIAKNEVNRSTSFKIARAADGLGTLAAVGGTGTYMVGRHKMKKDRNK